MLYAASLTGRIGVQFFQIAFIGNYAVASSVCAWQGSRVGIFYDTSWMFPWVTIVHIFHRDQAASPPPQASGGAFFVGASGAGSCYVTFEQCNVTRNLVSGTSQQARMDRARWSWPELGAALGRLLLRHWLLAARRI